MFPTSRDRGWNRFAGFILIALVTVLLVPSGGWAAARQGFSGLDRIDQAYREGRLSYGQALNYKVDALFHPNDLPVEYRPAAPLKSGAAVMREALAHREHLTAKNLQWLDRPTDGTFPYLDLNYGAVTVSAFDSLGGHFRLHYTTEDNNPSDNLPGDAVPSADVENADGSSAPSGNGIPDYVETYARYLEEAWNHEIGTLGFPAPASDGTLGGNGRRDIYIKNLNAYGLTIYTNTPADAYMVVENDYAENFPLNGNELCVWGNTLDCQKGSMKVTAVHEFFHVIQWQISVNCDGLAGRDQSNCWWMEASATWMEDEVYPTVKDYLNYVDDWFAFPEFPLDTYNGWFEYGTVVWTRYLSEKYGVGIIKEIWLTINDVQGIVALEAIRSVLVRKGCSLEMALREFRGKNAALIYWDDPYTDGTFYPGSVNKIYGDDLSEDFAVTFEGNCLPDPGGDCLLNPLSAYYYLFSAENLSQEGGLTISYQGKSGSATVLVVPMTNPFGEPVSASHSYAVSEVPLNGVQSGFLTVLPFGSTAQYKQVMVVILNTGELSSTGTVRVCFSPGGSASCPDSSIRNDVDLTLFRPCRVGSDSRCFIATAAYGSPFHPYVQLLRDFRDRYLLPHPAGAAFVEFYYRHSPPLARRVAEEPVLKGVMETALVPAVAFAAFMVKTTLVEKGLFFLVVWWGLRQRRQISGWGSRRL